MGLFDSLFGGGGSHSQTTTSTSNVTNTQLAGGNIGGPATYGSGNVVVTNQTDQGAVAAGAALGLSGVLAATDISHAALQMGSDYLNTGASVAIAGLNHAQDAYTSSLALVGNVTSNAINTEYGLATGAESSVSQFAGAALDSVSRFSSSALDANTFIAGKSLDSASAAYSNALASANGANAKALTAVEDIASQVSQSSQQTTDQTVTRIVWAIAIAAAVILVLPHFGSR